MKVLVSLLLEDSLDDKSTIVRDLRHLDVDPRCVWRRNTMLAIAKDKY
jgi:hypothetical protein